MPPTSNGSKTIVPTIDLEATGTGAALVHVSCNNLVFHTSQNYNYIIYTVTCRFFLNILPLYQDKSFTEVICLDVTWHEIVVSLFCELRQIEHLSKWS